MLAHRFYKRCARLDFKQIVCGLTRPFWRQCVPCKMAGRQSPGEGCLHVNRPGSLPLRGRIGAFTLHAQRDTRETTAKARAAFWPGLSVMDPDGVLDLDERRRRATAARKAYFARLALLSARARRGRCVAPSSEEVDDGPNA